MSVELTQNQLDVPQVGTGGRKPVPVWMFILLFLLLYWGMVYFDQRGAWFDEHVYAPYRSVEELTAYQPVNDEAGFLLKGKQLFHDNCAVCHMDTGIGNPANGCPPLVGSDWIAAKGPGRLIRIISKGAQGPIEVSGKAFPGGTMLAIGDALPGDENQKSEHIAAIISYIRDTFGNKAPPVSADKVKAVRAEIKDRNTNYSPKELLDAPE
jgi:mono/diheme cytochrome c family protein